MRRRLSGSVSIFGKVAESQDSSASASERPFAHASVLWQWALVKPGITRQPRASIVSIPSQSST